MRRGAWTDKRERQYDHIKSNLTKRGRPEETAERIAAATVNQIRAAKGETKEAKAPSERARAKRDMSAAGTQGREGETEPLAGIFRGIGALLGVMPSSRDPRRPGK